MDSRLGSKKTSCWRRRTTLEKSLLVVVVIVSTAVAMAVVMVTVTYSGMLSAEKKEGKKPTAEEVCLTPDCVKTAARILEAIDEAVDPCEDFFEYACGTWNRMNAIPDDRPTYSTFRQLDDQLQATLKDLLEAPPKPDDIIAIRNAKNLYQSCLDTVVIERRDDVPLREMLRDLGGWPVMEEDWSDERFNLTDVLAQMKTTYHLVLLNHWVGSDDKNSEVNILQIDQGQLGMPSREYFLRGRDDKTLMIYQSFITAVAEAMGASAEVASRDVAQMVDFEVALANITVPEERKRDMEAMYHRFRLKDLYGNLTDQIDWTPFFSKMFSLVNITIDEEEEVVVYTPGYVIELGKLLEITPKRTIANYVIWHLVNNRINHLSQRFLDLRREFNKAMMGTDQERARWRICVNFVNDNLGMAVGRMFVEKHFDEKAKTRALDMIKGIKVSFKELLEEVSWMDRSTKVFAQEKADVIVEKIGYPDYIMNDTALNLDYDGITSDSDRFFENVLNILRVTVVNNHKQLRLPAERDRWSTAPAVVNAFYSAPKNVIMFPAGIFHPPFYHENFPMSLNFGGIGMVIGHEITHGFDDKGRQFDKNGNLKQWWTENDIQHFIEKAQCIVDQYSNYTIPEVNININGRQTQGENIADNGGLKQAFRAYKTWAKAHPPEPKLPGLKLTHDQLFFLNFAQVWCGTSRPESYIQSIRASKHSPGKIRVIGSVSNSVDFARAFNCPENSSMNPTHKCSVW